MPRLNHKPAAGFSLVELLIVIAIISMLVSILMPAVMNAKRLAYKAQTQTRIVELSNGCVAYHSDNHFYPGQRYVSQWKDTDKLTGSQVLGAYLFGYTFAEAKGDVTTKAKGTYAPLAALAADPKTSDLFNPKGMGGSYALKDVDAPNSVSDRFGTSMERMPILYYPSRIGVKGVGQYVFDDNAAYTISKTASFTDQTGFENFIKNASTGAVVLDQQFLLIGANTDKPRKYGPNSPKNW